MTEKKIILHLCADTGSDSRPYQLNEEYQVIKVGADIGVENFTSPPNVYGIFANPVCTDFSIAATGQARDLQNGMVLVNECLRIIKEAESYGNLKFYVMENPASGRLNMNPGGSVLPGQKRRHYGETSTSQNVNSIPGTKCQNSPTCIFDQEEGNPR